MMVGYAREGKVWVSQVRTYIKACCEYAADEDLTPRSSALLSWA